MRYVGGVSIDAVHDGAVQLDNGVTINCDLVLAATGVRPQSGLAEKWSWRWPTAAPRSVPICEPLHPDVFAAGDIALGVGLDGGKARRGRALAGRRRSGRDRRRGSRGRRRGEWDDVPGFWTTIGDATVKYHAWGDGYGSRQADRT